MANQYEDAATSFDQVVVVPYSELLVSGVGLSDHRGGPIWPDWDRQTFARHCRKERVPVDAPPLAPDSAEESRFEEATWCGPITSHFGHQIADFSMRLHASRIASSSGPFVFAVPANSRVRDLNSAPSFFRQILAWFDIEPDCVEVVSRPMRFRKLHVHGQAECWHGPGASMPFLESMRQHVDQKLGRRRPSGRIYVSRSKLSPDIGRLAGESALDAMFRRNGFGVIYPESLPLEQQLVRYWNSEEIVFAEGSAVHALQLMGCGIGAVTVLNRRVGGRLGERFLRVRTQNLEYADVVQHEIAVGRLGNAPGAGRSRALSLLSWPSVADMLAERGIRVRRSDEKLLRDDMERDIRAWLTVVAHDPLRHHETRDHVVESLRLAGWPQMAELALELLRSVPAVSATAEECIRRARKSEATGNIPGAAASLEEATRHEDLHPGVRRLQSVFLERLGQLDEAMAAARCGREIDPGDRRLVGRVAHLLAQQKRWAEILELTEPYARFAQIGDEPLILARCTALCANGQATEGLRLISNAIGQGLNGAGMHARRAHLLHQLQRSREALAAIDQAIALAPAHAPHLLKHKSVVLWHLRRVAEAAEYARAAVKQEPRNVDFQLHLSRVLQDCSGAGPAPVKKPVWAPHARLWLKRIVPRRVVRWIPSSVRARIDRLLPANSTMSPP